MVAGAASTPRPHGSWGRRRQDPPCHPASPWPFGTSTVSFLQLFGIGAGLAILIDATLVRGILVPASMRVLGRAAWWTPGPLRRMHARVALEEA